MNQKGRGIRGVLVTNYIITMTIALGIGFFILQQMSEKSQEKKNYLAAIELTNTFTEFFELFLDKQTYVALEMAVDKELQAILSNNLEVDATAISNILNDIMIQNAAISSIHVIDKYNHFISEYALPSKEEYDIYFLKSLKVPTVRDDGGGQYIGINKSYVNGQPDNTLYISRSVYSKEDLEPLGYLIIFLNPNEIRASVMEYLERYNLEILLISNEEDEIFDFAHTNDLKQQYMAYKSGLLTKEEVEEWEKQYNHIEIDYIALDMHLIGRIKLSSNKEELINILLGITLINLIFLSIGMITLGKRVVYPLENIAIKAKKITQEADLSIRFEEDALSSEVNLIGQALNEMLNKITTLIQEGEEKERIQRILELSVINHQVNPHFLYNTLNSVAVLVAIEDKVTAGELIKALSRYYRACLNIEDIQSIEQEMVMTKEYINIMQLKNPKLFEVTYSIDEAIKGEEIPRMMLQTLVENSIKYGIKTMDEPLQIKITLQKDTLKKRIVLSVRDNGQGMDEAIRISILREEKLHGKSGFGLRSIIKRLMLMYDLPKVEDVLEIHTLLGQYTEVIIFIPLKLY